MGKAGDSPSYRALGIALAVAGLVLGSSYWIANVLLNDAPLAFLLALTLSCFSLEMVFKIVVLNSSEPFS